MRGHADPCDGHAIEQVDRAPLLAAVLAGAAVISAAVVRSGGRPRAGGHRSEVLSLYRRILRVAESWPSMKRKAVVVEIRQDFRRNAEERDAQKIEKMLSEARGGLKELMHDVAQGARLRATPSTPSWLRGEEMRGWPGEGDWSVHDQPQRRGLDKWALDELGVGASPTMAEAKAAYRLRAKACHPDSGHLKATDAEAFKRLTRAWEHVQQHLQQDVLRTQRGSRFR